MRLKRSLKYENSLLNRVEPIPIIAKDESSFKHVLIILMNVMNR